MRAALLQTNATDDPAENLVRTQAMVAEAADAGARFVLTPEVTNIISGDPAHMRAVLREETDDETLAALRTAAREHDVTLLIGSLAVLSEGPEGRFANRSFLINTNGEIVARYDKIHMFDVELTEAETYRESDRYRPGDQAVLADIGFAQVGVCICYDMRFPRLSDTLAQRGAQVLTYPSAFSRVSGAAHWETLLRARAIETGCWVLAPAQTGTHGTRQTWGHSMAVDPWGQVRLNAGEAPGVYTFELDLNLVADARRRIPALANARAFKEP